eukprot:TRINITY_DN21673_c0_g1_i1.p1 TRINITY_DN21673_c0_g1~~TRINITY_DN21673_c0_g1_i1.p1  ORF type:complete len:657 (+),score=121.86 TRINITY_DN21673_c0_g1_i1:61-2031(+)
MGASSSSTEDCAESSPLSRFAQDWVCCLRSPGVDPATKLVLEKLNEEDATSTRRSSVISETWVPYRASDLVDAEALTLLARTADLDRHEAGAWREEEVAALEAQAARGEDLPDDAVLRLWMGVPDNLKTRVWTAFSGVSEGASPVKTQEAAEEHYERALRNTFGEQVPKSFDQCPTFWGAVKGASRRDLVGSVPFIDLLSKKGLTAAHRILWCLSERNGHDVEYCPVIPVLVCLLLVFLPTEALVYRVVDVLLTRAAEAVEDTRRRHAFLFLPLTRAQWNKCGRRVVKLAESQMPDDEMQRLKEMGVDLHEVAVRGLEQSLAWQLPFRALCRAYGSFISEGVEVFARYLVALWINRQRKLWDAHDKEAAEGLLLPSPRLCGVAEVPRQAKVTKTPRNTAMCVDRLAHEALGLHVEQDVLRALRTGPLTGRLRVDSTSEEHVVFCRPRLSEECSSQLVWDTLWPYLWQKIPARWRHYDPSLVYRASRDGYSLRSMIAQCQEDINGESPILLLMRVRSLESSGGISDQGLIGAYLPEPPSWTGGSFREPHSQAADAFVFCVHGDEEKHSKPRCWRWSGENRMLWMASCTRSDALIGGTVAAISLDDELKRGSTGSCESFESPPLLGAAGAKEEGEDGGTPRIPAVSFNVYDLEIFALD